MARRYGRALRGRRLRVGVPHGRWKTITVVAGLRTSGVVAPFVLDGPINRAAFEAYVEKVLVPELRPGDVVILDNLSSHKGPSVRALIEAAGASLLYLPPYSPDFNPDRKCLRQAQSAPAQSRRTHRRGPLDRHRTPSRRLHTHRMRQLLRSRRIRCNLSGKRCSVRHDPQPAARKRCFSKRAFNRR